MSEAIYDLVLEHVARQVEHSPAMAEARASFMETWRATEAALKPAGYDGLAIELHEAANAAIAEAVRTTFREALYFDGGMLLWAAARRATLRTLEEEERGHVPGAA